MDRPGSVKFYESIDSEIKNKIPELTSAMVRLRISRGHSKRFKLSTTSTDFLTVYQFLFDLCRSPELASPKFAPFCRAV